MNPGSLPQGARMPGSTINSAISGALGAVTNNTNAVVNAARQTQASQGSGSGGSGGGAAASAFNINIKKDKPIVNKTKMPKDLGKNPTDAQKAKYWTDVKKFYTDQAAADVSQLNWYRAVLAETEARFSAPGYKMTEADAKELLTIRQTVAKQTEIYERDKNYADTINVNVGVSTSGDGDNQKVTKTYTITDINGNTINTQFTEDNGGMSAAELRAKQQADQQKALNASGSRAAAEAARLIDEIQAGAERDYALGVTETNQKAWEEQYGRDLANMDSGYAADRLQGNQDLLLASNETFSNAVKNQREANSILGQYNLGGSSLTGRLNNIASEAANQANQVASLTYNQRMQEAAKNYGNARTELENQNAAQMTANSQANAKANADYYARLGETAGQAYEDMAQYANKDYWYGTMFDSTGKRLNSYADMDSKAMQDYAQKQADTYTRYMNQYKNQQQVAAENQVKQKGQAYVSDYTAPAQKNYETGLREYRTANTNTMVPGQSQTELSQQESRL
jgi:hypothetical protein